MPDRSAAASPAKAPHPPAAGSNRVPPANDSPLPTSTPPALAQADWVVNVAPRAAAGAGATTYRWRHSGLQELLEAEPSNRYDFAAGLSHANPVVTANAAIALARLGDARGAERLVAAVGESQLRLPMRRAAVEALAALEDATTTEQLRGLLARLAGNGAATKSNYAPELHADLLRGVASRIDAGEDRHFATALRSTSAEVRLEAVRAWSTSRAGELPNEVADLRTDPDPRVRSAVVACVVARRLPRALEFAQAALADFHLDVRLAGVAGLGQLGGDEARAALARILPREAEAVRAAVVAALAEAGDDDAVFAAAEDTAWHVRRAVAATLSRSPDQRGALLAGRLLSDRSGEVRRQTVASLAAWPLERAGPLLLAAMDTAPYQTRKDAAAQLAGRWPRASEFSVDAPADRRSETLAALRTQWDAEFGAVDRTALEAALPMTSKPDGARARDRRRPADSTAASGDQHRRVADALARLDNAPEGSREYRLAVEQLTAIGQSLPAVLEQLVADHGRVLPEVVYRNALAQVDPAFAALVRLSSRSAPERRAAAKQLADLAAGKPLEPLAVRRLAELGSAEADALVWRELLRAVSSNAGDAATRLAYAGMTHPSPEVRRLSCGHLGAHPDPRHAATLVAALADQNSSVVRAALEALGGVGDLPDAQPLERLLTHDDHSLRVAAAAALARLDADAGPTALERLANDAEPKIRRQAVTAMGELGDTAYVFTLIERLDDDLGVRVAAIASLTRITGQDFSKDAGDTAAGLADQVQRWRRWWHAQGEARQPSAERERRKPDAR